ncbi:MAG: nucleotide-binding protein [Acidobacteriia bacterium]|nr:nucleotide-binding protein [Terriglobia bacterium]
MCAIAALILLAACSSKPAPTAAVASDRRSPAAAAAATPAAASASDAPAAGQTVTGTVLETMDASNYTYVRVKAGSRELWAAASQFKVAAGDKVVISLEQPMENFHSQTLNRDFPLIYFVPRIAPEGAAAAPALAVAHATAQSGAGSASGARQDAPMTPAPANATTVADVWKTRLALAGKKVTVHGRVVKFNGGILGVNWIHLQDGTGKAAEGSNDITITSETDTKVGDVITATGIVAIDKDLGSGYQYKVIIEHASLVRD